MTEWRPVVGHEGLYEVSDDGRVRSLPRTDARGCPVKGGILKPYSDGKGYLTVHLYRDSKRDSRAIHSLVSESFLGPRPIGMDVCHDDGDKLNNRVANLRYGTRSENLFDKRRHGTDHNGRKTHCPQGHPYAGDNLYVKPAGGRLCRTCMREQNREAGRRYRQRRAERFEDA